MAWAEQVGLGELGLMPEQFWRLTLREFWLKYEAFIRGENRAKVLVGLNALLTVPYPKEKRPSSPGQVLGWRKPVPLYPVQTWHTRRARKRMTDGAIDRD